VQVRRRTVAAGGLVLLIVIILLVSSCLGGSKGGAIESYNRGVSQLAQSSQQQVSAPLFAELVGASGKSALDVDTKISNLREVAQQQLARAQTMSVPGSLVGAQQYLLQVLDLRVEGLLKLARLVRNALGTPSSQAFTSIAGDMEIFLTSDVLYSQRVAPLIQQALAEAGVSGQSTASSRFLPNLGWLEASTVQARLKGESSAGSSSGPVAPGTHGHELVGVSVGTKALEPSPAINHISSGANPTFAVIVKNNSENKETDVKVDVSVLAGGKQLKASHIINVTEPGSSYTVDIPVVGVSLTLPASVKVTIEKVPGEDYLANNTATYLVAFS
jgi:hypothetical protein